MCSIYMNILIPLKFCVLVVYTIFQWYLKFQSIVSDTKLYVKLLIQVKWKFRKEINLRVLSHDEKNWLLHR